MQSMQMMTAGKLCSADEAVALIADGVTVAIGGFGGAAHPEGLLAALERRFLAEEHPRDLTLVYAAGQGDFQTRGLNHVNHDGMVRRIIGGHFGLAPGLGRRALEGDFEAYNIPQGVICQLYRDIAAGRPGCITHVGLDTFIDPIHDGGRLNDRTPEGLVERIEIGGRTWLLYHSFPIHVALIRATSSDERGNLVMDREVITGESLAMAQAAHNHGGIVLAQVESMREDPASPQMVKVPGVIVDNVVLAQGREHDQTFGEEFNPNYCSAAPPGVDMSALLPPMEMNERRIIAARAYDEIRDGDIVNLGFGMPEGIARIAAEKGTLDRFTLTVESGPFGGIPAGFMSFGASNYPEAIVSQPSQFDFYDGGGLDIALLGAAEVDGEGNVNVSKFGPKLAGVGGFVNITQSTKRVVFCGTFTAGGLVVAVEDGKLRILKEGKSSKFVEHVEQVSFAAKRALLSGQEILYITERAVFRLIEGGLELVEVAPGIDIDSQILAQAKCKLTVRNVTPMPVHVFDGP
jgi:propionate CoA-transferase